ncbi:MAG: 6-bladed beta-propeller [Bacteroidota bacterium]|nr:6-bladed beta-propeller [Bacteroidota bacterium]MDP4215004.1 6-bladed beta-propeller [Bacteroidota bacterium]MDP4244249.1 6-bladed beta-propeller [Bacteroidota bacterium]MDP4254086.1 6-bladed beta-propeller [Bacteroidota bacterium]MDP4257004.1 6-bladed beta-propeller [Bacteroidota bacterium]
MERRQFLQRTTVAAGGLLLMKDLFANTKGKVYGHNGMQYSLDTSWSHADPQRFPVNDCHEMVQDRKGRILLLTNETHNNVLIYTTKGKLLDSWGHDFPGAHGLTLHDENGTEFLYITDTVKHQVYKATLDGRILLTIDAPFEAGIYKKAEEFVPTETTIDENGDIFIADGYGAQYIMQYDSAGKLKKYFGGRGEGDKHFDNAHGICFDRRGGRKDLLITDRTRNCFKRFSTDGELLELIRLPGACVCRPVIHGDHLYAAVLRSPDLNAVGTGFVTILDKDNKVVSNIGGSEPQYSDGQLQPMRQTDKIFVHPHDVCVDRDDNLYVAQWSSGKVYPYKLKKV